MAQSKFSCKVEDKSVECSICFSDYDQPKYLPCSHTFCFACLKKLCEEQNEGDKKPCPLCRREFCIPQGGVDKLPNNYFMMRLVLMKNSEEKLKPVQCYLCSEIGEVVDAEAFCKECAQCICSRCKRIHSVATASKFHHVVSLEERPNEEQLMKMQSNYCEKHANKEMEFYCCDCYALLCSICQFESHGKHKCQLLYDVVTQKKEGFDKDNIRLKKCLAESQDQCKKFQLKRVNTLQQVSKTTQSIQEAYESFVKLCLSGKNKLIDNLEAIKASLLREIDEIENENQLHSTELDSFQEYCKMVMVKEMTNCEIIRVADELHKRAEELIKSQDERNNQELSNCCIEFNPSRAPTLDDSEGFIGKLSYTPHTVSVKSSVSASPLSPSTHEPASHNSADFNTHKILAIAVMGNQLFLIGRDQMCINVYDAITGAVQPPISVPSMKRPQGLASSEFYRALYISDGESRCILSLTLFCGTITQKCWKLPEEYDPISLSVTLQQNLLVTVRVWVQYRLVLYASEGQLIRDIELDSSIEEAHQSIRIFGDRYIICHGLSESSFHRVCVVDSNGQIIKSYGGRRGQSYGRLCRPRSIHMDNNRGHVFVADSGNRVLIFSKDLVPIGQVQMQDGITSISSLYFDSSSNRLFVSDLNARRVFTFSSDKFIMNT